MTEQIAEQLTGAQSLVKALEHAGVDVIFGIPGGAVLPVYDPLFDSQQLRHVLVRHEQGAGHAASGYAHATGRVKELPVRKPKKTSPEKHATMLVLIDARQVLLEQRPASGIWGGVKVYVGANDKPLIARHRRDDPPVWLNDTISTLGNSRL